MSLNLALLSNFTGSEEFYRHALLPRIVYTEGARYVAENAGAYWLLDAIAAHQLERRIAAEEFQSWKLEVSGDSASLTCDDGNGNIVATVDIPYTDFPAPGITLWFSNNTIMLPSEY